MVRGLPTGAYQVRVLHPNVIGQLVDMRRVRCSRAADQDHGAAAEELFRDTPVRETADADLTPPQRAAVAARDLVTAAGGDQAGTRSAARTGTLWSGRWATSPPRWPS